MLSTSFALLVCACLPSGSFDCSILCELRIGWVTKKEYMEPVNECVVLGWGFEGFEEADVDGVDDDAEEDAEHFEGGVE